MKSNIALTAYKYLAMTSYIYDYGSCTAIKLAGEKLNRFDEARYLARMYRELFAPVTAVRDEYWLRGHIDTVEERYQWRLTALCFFAAMIDSGDI